MNELSIGWNDAASALILSCGSTAFTLPITPSLGSWIHLVWSMQPVAGGTGGSSGVSGSSWFVYLNGAVLPAGTTATVATQFGVPTLQGDATAFPQSASRSQAYLGRSLSAASNANAEYDAFRVYDVVLAAGTVQQLARAYGLYSPNLLLNGDATPLLSSSDLTVFSSIASSPVPAPIVSNVVPTATALPFTSSNEDALVVALLGPAYGPHLVYSLSFPTNPLLAINAARLAAGGFALTRSLSYSWEEVDLRDSANVAVYHEGLVWINSSYMDLTSTGDSSSSGQPPLPQLFAEAGAGWTVELVVKLLSVPQNASAKLFELTDPDTGDTLDCGWLADTMQLECQNDNANAPGLYAAEVALPFNVVLGAWYHLVLVMEPVASPVGSANWYVWVNGVLLPPEDAGTAVVTSYGVLSTVSSEDGASMPQSANRSFAQLAALNSKVTSTSMPCTMHSDCTTPCCRLTSSPLWPLAYGCYTPALLTASGLSASPAVYPPLSLNASAVTLATYTQPLTYVIGSEYSQWSNASASGGSTGNSWQLVQLAPGAQVTWDDGSTSTTQVTQTTVVSAEFDWRCAASAVQHVVVNATITPTLVNTSRSNPSQAAANNTNSLAQLFQLSPIATACNASNAVSVKTVVTVAITNTTSTTSTHTTTATGRPTSATSRTTNTTVTGVAWLTQLSGSQNASYFALEYVNTSQPFLQQADGTVYVPVTAVQGVLTLVVPAAFRGPNGTTTTYTNNTVVTFPAVVTSLAFNSTVQSYAVNGYSSQVRLVLASGDEVSYARTAASIAPINGSALAPFSGYNQTNTSVPITVQHQRRAASNARSGSSNNISANCGGVSLRCPATVQVCLRLQSNVTLSRRAVTDHLLDAYVTVAPGAVLQPCPSHSHHRSTSSQGLGTFPTTPSLRGDADTRAGVDQPGSSRT